VNDPSAGVGLAPGTIPRDLQESAAAAAQQAANPQAQPPSNIHAIESQGNAGEMADRLVADRGRYERSMQEDRASAQDAYDMQNARGRYTPTDPTYGEAGRGRGMVAGDRELANRRSRAFGPAPPRGVASYGVGPVGAEVGGGLEGPPPGGETSIQALPEGAGTGPRWEQAMKGLQGSMGSMGGPPKPPLQPEGAAMDVQPLQNEGGGRDRLMRAMEMQNMRGRLQPQPMRRGYGMGRMGRGRGPASY
jgi:hypothetical protein